jgi:hypothetical protein
VGLVSVLGEGFLERERERESASAFLLYILRFLRCQLSRNSR